MTSSAFPSDASSSPVMISDRIWGAGRTSAAASTAAPEAARDDAGCCASVTDADGASAACEGVRTCEVTACGVGRVSGGTGGSGGGVVRSLPFSVVTAAAGFTSIFATTPAAVSPLTCFADTTIDAPDTAA